MTRVLLLWYTIALRCVFMVVVVVMVGRAIAIAEIEVDVVVVVFITAIALVHIRVLAVLIVVLLVGFLRRLIAIIVRGRLGSSWLIGCCLGLWRGLVVIVAGGHQQDVEAMGQTRYSQISEEVVFEVFRFCHGDCWS